MTPALHQLPILAVDCQATGNSPQNSHLLEIGWLACRAETPVNALQPQTHLIQLPENDALPARIQKLTGIKTTDLIHAVPVATAIQALMAKAARVASANRVVHCPTVIHYARFEMGFLKHHCPEFSPLPLDVICTHQMATRLLPELPRKGLRAVAGYLGHSVPTPKRCHSHLVATAWIWRHLVQRLAAQTDIRTWDQLRHWLTHSEKPATPKTYPMPARIRSNLPSGPGVYYMKRSNGDVIYIGKATSLRQRIRSYFYNSRRHSESTLEMLSQARDLDITPTPTALEAALLETDVIKQHNPPYNIALTPNHRGLFYLSPDFSRHALQPGHDYTLGPVPFFEPFAAAHALGKLITQSRLEPNCVSDIMAIPEDYLPEPKTFD